MTLLKIALSGAIIALLLAVMVLGGPQQAYGDLHWQPARKEVLRVRLIALSLGFPRSSFFATHEVFIAEKQLERNEGLLVKLVYEFLPYQPRLSDHGLDYTVLHELRAVRDPACDETLRQMSSPQNVPEWPRPDQSWKYADEAPSLNLKRHRSSLPCYETTADDYSKSVHEPLGHQF